MVDRIENELRLTQKALGLRAYRQELLASNIANADTPHYKARDIEFKSALDNALSGRMGGDLALARTSPKHLANDVGNGYGADLKYRTEYQSAVDGNTVNMDVERAAFAENAVHMEALLAFVSNRMKDMQTAIQAQ